MQKKEKSLVALGLVFLMLLAAVFPFVGRTMEVKAATSETSVEHNFTKNGKTSSFFTISGNLSKSKGTVTYNGLKLTQCLKMESKTSISFKASAEGTLTLVFLEKGKAGAANVDGKSYKSDSAGIVQVSLKAGTHTIKKESVSNLFYMSFASKGSVETPTEKPTEKPTETPTEKPTETPTVTPVSGDIYVSPSGKSSASGSSSDPMDFVTAISKVKAGNTIWMQAGTYKFTKTIVIAESNSGSNGKYKKVGSKGGNVVLDFTGMAEDGANRGIVLDGSYWHFYDIDITNAGDNGMLLSGDHNIIEMCQFYNNHDTGLQLSRYNTKYASKDQWPSYNLIKNCTSFNNKDDATSENADGFAAKLTCGEGNVFDGCIAYCNSDDGWDLYAKPATGAIGVVTIKNCVAFGNGKTTNGQGSANGDMNGFKLGGSNGACPTPHVVTNCVAFWNGACGFTDNGNGGALKMSNCTSADNAVFSAKANYLCYRTSQSASYTNLLSVNTNKKVGTDKFKGSLEKTLYFYSSGSSYYWVDAKNTSSFTGAGIKFGTANAKTVSGSDFVSTTLAGYNASKATYATNYHETLRNSDGSVNLHGLYQLKSSSPLYKAGTNGSVLGAAL